MDTPWSQFCHGGEFNLAQATNEVTGLAGLRNRTNMESNMFNQTRRIILGAAALAVLSGCASIPDLPNPLKQPDIVDTAVAAGSFKTLVAAVQAADLVDTLKGDGPFTVFAPTDEAFAKLPDGTVESLLKPENKEKLQAILTYHVVAGKVMAADITGKTMDAASVNGKTLSVDGTNGVTVNGATVVSADVSASNGVIHVIDAVLLP